MSFKSSSSLFQDTLRIIGMLQHLEEWQAVYYDPLIASPEYAEKSPIDILWSLFRQGGTLCFSVNLVQKNTIRDIAPLNLSDSKPFDGPGCKKNVYNFLIACSEAFFMPEDELFQVADIYKEDLGIYSKALHLVEGMLLRYGSSHGIDFSVPKEEPSSLLHTSSKVSTAETDGGLREKVIEEILVTERNYVADLEKLKSYMDLVHSDKNCTLSKESIAWLFSNLDEVLEFQRRFLIDMEAILYGPNEKRLLGKLFMDSLSPSKTGSSIHNKKFSTYYEFCSNYPKAINEATIRAEDLHKYDKIIPSSQLPSYLIKPVQRICKYPLLMRELLKKTPETHPDYPNIEQGLDVMKRVAANVNEENRRGENRLIVEDLAKRVDDWKGLDIQIFGSLIFMDTMNVKFNDSEKEYMVYFFDSYILFCKEAPPSKKKDYREILIRHHLSSSRFINVNDASVGGKMIIKCYWKDKHEVQFCTLECRTEEIFLKYLNAINEKVQQNKTSLTDNPRKSSVLSNASNASFDDTASVMSKLKPLTEETEVNPPRYQSLPDINKPIKENRPLSRTSFGSSKAASTNAETVSSDNTTDPSQIQLLKLTFSNHHWIMRFPSADLVKGYYKTLREVACSKLLANISRYDDLAKTIGSKQIKEEEILLFYIDQENDEIEVANEADIMLCFEEARGKKSVHFSVKLSES